MRYTFTVTVEFIPDMGRDGCWRALWPRTDGTDGKDWDTHPGAALRAALESALESMGRAGKAPRLTRAPDGERAPALRLVCG